MSCLSGLGKFVRTHRQLRRSRRRAPIRRTIRPKLEMLETRDCPSSLAFSTYLGGSGNDGGFAIAVDSAGNCYVAGATFSADLAVTSGAYDTTYNGGHDGFIAKLSPTGASLWATYLGGSSDETPEAIAVDSSGNVYVTGQTSSTDFPTTAGAFRTAYPGATSVFVTKLNSTGSALLYSTFLGGGSGTSIAVDAAGDVFVAGQTSSHDFPTTPGAFQTSLPGHFVAGTVTELNPSGSGLIYSTYLGGSNGYQQVVFGIAVDAAGNAYVTGDTDATDFPTTPGAFQPTNTVTTRDYYGMPSDAFVAKLNAGGTGLIYSTYLGGTSNGDGLGIAIDGSDNAYVVGQTTATDFPTTIGAFQTTFGGGWDVFVSKVNATGSGLVYSTYLGGSSIDLVSQSANPIAVDAAGNVYVEGYTSSTNFPTANAVQATFSGGPFDAFVTKLNAGGTGLNYSTFLGGSGNQQYLSPGSIAIDGAGNAYVTGSTTSTDFPTVNAFQSANAGGYDAFVAKILGQPIQLSSLGGFVWEDFNDDGQIDFGEQGINGVAVRLQGTDVFGHTVDETVSTDANGSYQFARLGQGTYTITETQPAGDNQGINTLGTCGGTVMGDVFTVEVGPGDDCMNYNYGERPVNGSGVTHGQTAGIGFWNNKNGQALIKALNGGATATQLGNWLAATFVNIFGANAGSNNLAGMTNAQVAAAFQQKFVVKGQKLDAQVMATALSVFVTNQVLAGDVATAYGFDVTHDGVGIATFNVGNDGAAVGKANNTTMSIMDILLATDALSANANGLLYGGDSTKRNAANDLYSAINAAGSVS